MQSLLCKLNGQALAIVVVALSVAAERRTVVSLIGGGIELIAALRITLALGIRTDFLKQGLLQCQQRRGRLLEVLLGDAGENFQFYALDSLSDGVDELPARLGEKHASGTSVGRVGSPLDVAASFQPIEQPANGNP